MTVRSQPNREQTAIRDHAQHLLRQHPYRVLSGIRCECDDGLLTLRGCRPTYFLKQLAQVVVAETEGLQRIENLIVVLPPDRTT